MANSRAIWATDRAIQLLRELWDDPAVSASEIARRIGAPSKSATIGKAHRLHLMPRESPILPRSERAAKREVNRAPLRVGAPGILLPLASATLPPVAPLPVIAAPPMAIPVIAALPPPLPMPAPARHGRPCQFPHGDPGTRGFRFCGCASLLGKSWCAEHYARVFVRVGRRGLEESAATERARAALVRQHMARVSQHMARVNGGPAA